ncbi:hypothetical protein [Paenibacillus sp. yr247]|nr:hypothetical protein [Paenibacillus sp. yr247]
MNETRTTFIKNALAFAEEKLEEIVAITRAVNDTFFLRSKLL